MSKRQDAALGDNLAQLGLLLSWAGFVDVKKRGGRVQGEGSILSETWWCWEPTTNFPGAARFPQASLFKRFLETPPPAMTVIIAAPFVLWRRLVEEIRRVSNWRRFYHLATQTSLSIFSYLAKWALKTRIMEASSFHLSCRSLFVSKASLPPKLVKGLVDLSSAIVYAFGCNIPEAIPS